MSTKSVFILDDHDIVRYGLEMLVTSCPQLRLVGSAPTLAEGVVRIADLAPDLVITDISMDDSKGLDTVRAVVDAQQGRAVLVVSMHDEVLFGEQVMALGARGYLMKESAHAHCIPAALQILAGGNWVSPALNARVLDRLSRRSGGPGGGKPAARDVLSVRELEVLVKLGAGKTTKEIAADLGLSVRTVDIHRSNIKRKLGLKTGAELIAFSVTHA
jgi:DNA-binding NarL/FixJ family response regulator